MSADFAVIFKLGDLVCEKRVEKACCVQVVSWCCWVLVAFFV
jgi:hypothetical protein